MVATEEDPADLSIIHTSKIYAAEVTSTFDEEKTAPLVALD